MKIRSFAGAAALGGLVLGLLTGPAAADEWRGWNIHPEDYPVSAGMEEFARLVAERTGGRITMKIYHNAVLGDQPDAIEQVRLGGIDFGEFNLGPLGQVVPEANVVSLPFIFKSVDAMHKVMDGPVGEDIAAGLAAKGLVSLGWYDSGARSFYDTKKPITQPADLEGMKMRVMNNDLFVAMVTAMGGNATPMPYGDVYQSLQNGVIDGAENNYPSYESSGHYEAAGFYSLTEHLIIPECLCINKMLFDSLSAEDQQILRQAGQESAVLQRKLWAEREEVSKAKVIAAGVQINEIPDKSAFQAAMKPVYDKFIADNPALEPLVRKIQAAQ
jgi:tripartite ATP-independent transporter DctP family solute receptor